MKMKKVAKHTIHQSKRTGRWYGRQTIDEDTEYAWVTRQDKHGWSLGLALGKRTVWLRSIRFKTEKAVKQAMRRYPVVAIPLKDSAKQK